MYDSSAITQPRAEQESEQVAMQQEERVLTEQSMQKDKQDMEAREESANMVEDAGMLPIEKWTESDVSSWMRSIGVKEQYIQKLEKEEVNGKIILELTEDDLKQETGITSLVARLIIRKINEFVDKGLKTKEIKGSQQSGHGRQKGGKKGKKDVDHKKDETDQICPEAEPQAHQDQLVCVLPTKRDCKPRPLGKEGIDFTYAKHNVLQPESGAFDLIYPCHEYKSLRNATKLDRTRLQAKFAKEVLKFGTGCMNIRSNGTIHFGVMDSKDDAGYVHGEIIGVPVLEKDIYSDALDHIEKCFSSSDSEHVRQCIRPPQFIEVMDIKSTETRYVVEVDIVPSISIVKNRVYSVRLPNFKESTNKIELEKKTIYRRVGSKTEPVSDENVFYQRVRDRDDQREKAEHCPSNTFVLMSEDFKPEYVEHFVKDLLKGIDHESAVTRLIKYVALLNIFVQNSFISQSHCEALLTFTTLTTANKSDQRKETEQKRFPQHAFEKHLSEQAKLLFTHSNDEKTHIQAVKIIHPRVAKEILHQLLDNEQQQEKVAMDLLHEDVLFQHRFAREPYVTFLRDLFMRRYRVDKGDKSDSLFSPLIELVRKETPEKAIKLLEEAHKRFDQDAFFAQQLARLNYCYEKFEEAEVWAVKAETKLPNNSFILDTKGHVYRRWFDAKCNAIDQVPKTAENIAGAVETALKAMECFQKCETIAISDPETMNNAGFFGTVTVGCSLLKLMFSMPVFSDKTANGCTERLNYLLTEDYIPKEVMKPWEKFHSKLKNLRKRLHESLDWISEDLSFFQTDISSDQEEASENLDKKHPKNWSVHKPIANRGTSAQSSEKMSHPKNWLTNKYSFYGKTFSDVSVSAILKQCKSNPQSVTPFTKRMAIYNLGGGNLTTIFSLLTEQKDENPQSLRDKEQKQKKDQHQVKKKHPVKILEDIISLYPSNPLSARLDQKDLVNYIATHIALSCLSTPSTKLAGLKQLQTLSNQFTQDRKKCLSDALFLLTLLFWPEEHDSDEEKERKYDIVHSAVESLEDSYWAKMKDIPPKKRRLYTHVFLGNGIGLEKIVHKSKVASITKLFSLPERRIKWLSGEVWKMPEIAKLFKCVSGWTEDGTVYLVGPTKKFAIHSLHAGSVPYGSENVTFYLGFTFRGPVAYNITVKR
ncbi:sterile alpha motif domain-containing protein 9-like isoform X3 [Oncorhynchus mykiss]|uniref:sterile alpha motif domain-containing protein 9-like isoform X3 n=1 Tax=Oncorhynchus mykiss TaxID=8022 RepID=UPI0018789C2D|nr:sterile alpha motif domain-containing protein 9-like isoform X3 [Oncorhynchus mykiss]